MLILILERCTRPRQELSHVVLVVQINFDTAESELAKVARGFHLTQPHRISIGQLGAVCVELLSWLPAGGGVHASRLLRGQSTPPRRHAV